MKQTKISKVTNEALARIIAKGFESVENRMATKSDIKDMATKNDLQKLKYELREEFKEGMDKLREDVVSDIDALNAVHYIELTKTNGRVSNLEKTVFGKNM